MAEEKQSSDSLKVSHREVTLEEGSSDNSKQVENQVSKILAAVEEGIKQNSGNKDVLSAYAQIINATVSPQNSLPKSISIHFGLTKKELEVLFSYMVGVLFIVLVVSIFDNFVPSTGWKASDVTTLILYWTILVGVLLGVQTLPQNIGSLLGIETKQK
jgi:hypothetical protein